MADPTCPMCRGPLEGPRQVALCGGCHQALVTSGAIRLSSTSEFAAMTPQVASAILGQPSESGIAESHRGAACSWCGKARDSVKKLLVGERASICNECVALCVDILEVEVENWRG